MKLSLFLIGGLALVFGGYAVGGAQSSDKNSIEFGTTVLRPGMAKDSVVAALAKYYSVNDDGSVISKAGPPHSNEGSLVFKDGKLTSVWKNWSPSNQKQSYELANNLYGLFNGLKNEGSVECVLGTEAKQANDGGEKKSIFVFCGEKEVRIDAVHWPSGDKLDEAVVVTEILRAKE